MYTMSQFQNPEVFQPIRQFRMNIGARDLENFFYF